jgi:nucleotide-binding universal stress UspA family protein
MTTPPARIVVGLDGSPASIAALRWAIAQAAMTSARVQAITTWSAPPQYGADVFTTAVDWAAMAQRSQETALKEATDGAPSDVEALIRRGHPAHVLTAASAGASLLVVGSRGHGGFAGLLLGSVSEYVSAHAACPVLVVRDGAPAAAEPVPA